MNFKETMSGEIEAATEDFIGCKKVFEIGHSERMSAIDKAFDDLARSSVKHDDNIKKLDNVIEGLKGLLDE